MRRYVESLEMKNGHPVQRKLSRMVTVHHQQPMIGPFFPGIQLFNSTLFIFIKTVKNAIESAINCSFKGSRPLTNNIDRPIKHSLPLT